MRIIASGLIFLLPGYATLSALHPKLDLDVPQRLMVSTGLSVAVLPLLLFGSSLLGIKLGPLSVALLFLFLGMVSIWRVRGELLRKSSWKRFRAQIDAIYLLLLLIFALGLLVRFLMVRDLVVPMWGDSYHHTMISQLLVDNGGLFSSWEPYAPLRSFTYHFGFHSLVAFYHWLTGVSVIESVIVVGQLLNALSIPLAYLLTERLTQERWAGLIAALITGLLSPMPLYYVNWGRYTQLAGQIILPVAMIFALESIKKGDARTMGIAILASSGLFLVHYRVAVFYFCFVLVLLAWESYREWGKKTVLDIWRTIAVIGLASVALITPWIWNLGRGFLPQSLFTLLTTPQPGGEMNLYNALGDVAFFVPPYLLLLALGGVALGFIRRNRGVIVTALWVGVLLLLANPYALRLPGTGLVNNFAVLIALYIPVSLAGGFLVSQMMGLATGRFPQDEKMAVLLLALVALLSILRTPLTLAEENMLVTDADVRAMGWIRENTASNSKFLVNYFFHLGETVVGSDAGWWIPLLTGRKNTVPPITYLSEEPNESNYSEEVATLARRLEDASFDDPETVRLLKKESITHIYVGEKGGNLSPEQFLWSPCYEEIYHLDKVWIFEVKYACPGMEWQE